MQPCVGLRDALECTEMLLRGYAYIHVELLTFKAAETQS